MCVVFPFPRRCQSEERDYWEVPATYFKLSPFSYARDLAAKQVPLLFVHGDNDNNPGTFPMQSERMYAAVAGQGGIAKLVLLPHESHGYAARESIMHTLAEQHAWLTRWVVDQEPKPPPPPPKPWVGKSKKGPAAAVAAATAASASNPKSVAAAEAAEVAAFPLSLVVASATVAALVAIVVGQKYKAR